MLAYEYNDTNANQAFQYDKYANDMNELESCLKELDLKLEDVLALKDGNEINYFELIEAEVLKAL